MGKFKNFLNESSSSSNRKFVIGNDKEGETFLGKRFKFGDLKDALVFKSLEDLDDYEDKYSDKIEGFTMPFEIINGKTVSVY